MNGVRKQPGDVLVLGSPEREYDAVVSLALLQLECFVLGSQRAEEENRHENVDSRLSTLHQRVPVDWRPACAVFYYHGQMWAAARRGLRLDQDAEHQVRDGFSQAIRGLHATTFSDKVWRRS